MTRCPLPLRLTQVCCLPPLDSAGSSSSTATAHAHSWSHGALLVTQLSVKNCVTVFDFNGGFKGSSMEHSAFTDVTTNNFRCDTARRGVCADVKINQGVMVTHAPILG